MFLSQEKLAARWRALRIGNLLVLRLTKSKLWHERCTSRLLTVRLAPWFSLVVIWANVWLLRLCTIWLSRQLPCSFKASCPLQFAWLLDFFHHPSILGTLLILLSRKIMVCLPISEIVCYMHRKHIFCPQSKTSKPRALLILAVEMTDSQQPKYLHYIQLP